MEQAELKNIERFNENSIKETWLNLFKSQAE